MRLPRSDCGQRENIANKTLATQDGVWEAAPSSQLATNSLAAEERSASAATFRLSVQFFQSLRLVEATTDAVRGGMERFERTLGH